ncbi:hypothetical protein [Oceanobacillus indicireducens]|uniref:Uncharacterized protein n=1 Tax=Oceanobacillus indicireducens TaxID=1004261 RepID=A0A917Y2Q1_9BACI|nr:hypothetical protein [Oceanobacillus indicireducens]GGN64386.1 hypothetical protein GCM10007971_32220 [Oceanobacillus indicireducens]
MQAISRVRHPDKYQCVLRCIEKENEGFECISPIQLVSDYWEAVYVKKLS